MAFEGIDISAILAAIGVLTLCTNVVTEVFKRAFGGFPAQITAVVVAMVLTVCAFFAYTSICGIVVEWYMVVGAVVTGFFVSYAAQFGFDKLKEIISEYNKGGEK